MSGKQDKIPSYREIMQVFANLKGIQYPHRNQDMREISLLTWSMVTDASSQTSDTHHLPDNFSKGKLGRIILFNTALKKALIDTYEGRIVNLANTLYLVSGIERLSHAISHWFREVFKALCVWKGVQATQDVGFLSSVLLKLSG